MNSRLDTLRSQLETLSFENLKSSSAAHSHSVSQKKTVQNDIEKRFKEHSELKRTYTELSQSTFKQEEIQRNQLQELEIQLDVILTQKRREKANLRRQTERIKAQIEAHKESLTKIEKQIQKIEEKSENVQVLIKEEHTTKLDAFKCALKPLEDTEITIKEERVSLKAQMETLSERLRLLEQSYESKKAELDTKQLEKQESLSYKSKILSTLEEIKKKYQHDYKMFFQEIETKEILTSIKDKKTKQIATLKETDQNLAILDAELERANNELTALETDNRQNPQYTKTEREIIEGEKLLSLKSKDLQIRPLNDIISQQCINHNFPVSQHILKEQFKIIEAKEFDLIEEWKQEQEQMEAKIQEMKKLADEQESEVLCMVSSDQTDPALENMLLDMQNALSRMRNEAEKAKRRHRCKMAVIGQWKNKNRSILLLENPASLPNDTEISKAFKKQLAQATKNPNEINSIESVLTNYLNKVCQREQILGRDTEDLNEKHIRIAQQLELVNDLKGRRFALNNQKDTLQKEFLKILLLEKAAIKKFENTKADVELQKRKQVTETVGLNLKNNQELLQIQKTYGDKALKKIKEQETKTLNENAKKGNKEIRKKLEEIQIEMQHWEKEIDKLDLTISENIMPDINALEEEITTLTRQVRSIKTQDQILAEAEDDVADKLESLMESKKIDITRSLQRIVSKHGGEIDLSRLDKFKMTRDKKEKAIDELERELEMINKDFCDKLTFCDVDEAKIRTRVSQLQEELVALQQDKAKISVLGRKLKISQKQLETLGIAEEDIAIFISESAPLRVQTVEKKTMTRSQSLPRLGIEDLELENNPLEIEREEAEPVMVEPEKSKEIEISPAKLMADTNENQDINNDSPTEPEPKFKFSFKDLNKAEINFLETIRPLLEGSMIYKKLSQRNSLQTSEFDPLAPENPSPDECGYALRNFSLFKGLNKIEIRRPNKPGIESNILIEHVLDIVLPKHTLEILKSKKKSMMSNDELLDPAQAVKKYQEMRETGHINYFDPSFRVLADSCDFYPFFITLEKGGRVELIADSYASYRIWVDGVQALIKFRKQLGRLKYKIIS